MNLFRDLVEVSETEILKKWNYQKQNFQKEPLEESKSELLKKFEDGTYERSLEELLKNS